MNTKNMAFAYLCCTSLNLGTMPPKLLPLSTEQGKVGIQMIGQYKVISRNSVA